MIVEAFENMLLTYEASKQSNCLKRKIGVVVPVGHGETVFGYNISPEPCTACHRNTCSAIHAEVTAVTMLIMTQENRAATSLYIWAEVPCHACLSFIRRYSSIAKVYCLSPESYLTEYPLIARRSEEILQRRSYAKSLGIDIIELDREEIMQYELFKHNKTNVQPNQA